MQKKQYVVSVYGWAKVCFHINAVPVRRYNSVKDYQDTLLLFNLHSNHRHYFFCLCFPLIWININQIRIIYSKVPGRETTHPPAQKIPQCLRTLEWYQWRYTTWLYQEALHHLWMSAHIKKPEWAQHDRSDMQTDHHHFKLTHKPKKN